LWILNERKKVEEEKKVEGKVFGDNCCCGEYGGNLVSVGELYAKFMIMRKFDKKMFGFMSHERV
jgi:hypothetical protein